MTAPVNVTIPSTCTDACNRTGSSEVVICESGGTVRRFSLSSLVQVGANITTISSPNAIAMIGANKAAVGTFGTTNVAIVDLAGPSSTTIPSMDFTYTSGKPQMIAGNISTEMGLMCGFTTGRLIQFDGAAVSAAVLSPTWLRNTKASTVIARPDNNNFIVGTEKGFIVECDEDGNEVSCYMLPLSNFINYESVSSERAIVTMAMAYGLLFVSTQQGLVYTIAWDTKKILSVQAYMENGLYISNIDSVVALVAAFNTAVGDKRLITHMDMMTQPWTPYEKFYHEDSFTRIVAMGVQGTKGWVIPFTSTKMTVRDEALPRTITTQNISAEDPGAIDAELIVIQDAGAVGDAQVTFNHMIPAAGQDIPLTSSSEYVRIAKYKSGANTKFDVRRVTT